jgi:hypothetical protein
MRTFAHVMIVLGCGLGGLTLLVSTFSGSMSAIQQAAIAAMVAAWIIIFHTFSSMLDRRN